MVSEATWCLSHSHVELHLPREAFIERVELFPWKEFGFWQGFWVTAWVGWKSLKAISIIFPTTHTLPEKNLPYQWRWMETASTSLPLIRWQIANQNPHSTLKLFLQGPVYQLPGNRSGAFIIHTCNESDFAFLITTVSWQLQNPKRSLNCSVDVQCKQHERRNFSEAFLIRLTVLIAAPRIANDLRVVILVSRSRIALRYRAGRLVPQHS